MLHQEFFMKKLRKGYYPKHHKKYHTPFFAIVVVWIISCILIILASFGAEYIYSSLSNQVVFAWCVSWTIALFAAIKYRKLFYSEIKEHGWVQPLFPLFPVVGIIGALMIMWTSYSSEIIQLLIGVLWLTILIIYYLYVKNKNLKDI